MSIATEPSPWDLIDHALVGLKRTELAGDMHKTVKAEENRIRFDNRHNQNSQAVPALLLQMHERRIDEHVEKTYKIYCEVWEKQGYSKTAEFVRAVSAHVVPVIIGARKNAVIAWLSMERARTAGLLELHKARIASFEQSMQRLAAHWLRKLEVEARECEHAARLRHSKQMGSFDQRGNLAKAISGRKAEIERINRVLDNLPSPGTCGTYGKPIKVSQNAVRDLIQRRIEHEAALVELEKEQARLNACDAHAQEQQPGSLGQAQQASGNQSNTHAPAHNVFNRKLKITDQGDEGLIQNRRSAHVQSVAPGIGQVSLVDLNAPVGESLKEAKRAILKLGAPAHELKDPRILEAADYKIRNPSSTYPEVSIKFFGIAQRADSIRYWVNKRKSSGDKL